MISTCNKSNSDKNNKKQYNIDKKNFKHNNDKNIYKNNGNNSAKIMITKKIVKNNKL